MRGRMFAGGVFAAAVVLSLVIYHRLNANAEPVRETVALPGGLKVTAIPLSQKDWTAELFNGAIYRFQIESPGPDRLVDVYIDRMHKGKKVGTIGGLGVMPMNANASLSMDCSIAFVPMGKNLYEAEKVKVTTMIMHNSSSLILPNPLKGLPTVTFGSAVYTGNGSWKAFSAGQPGTVPSTMMAEESIVIRFDVIRPNIKSSGAKVAR